MRSGRRSPLLLPRAAAAASLAAALAAALLLLPSPATSQLTTVPSGIEGVDHHYSAGLFEWSDDCGNDGDGDDDVDFCGALDFCRGFNDLSYGFAFYGGPCQFFNGPTIRLQAGNRYRLTLRNTSPPGKNHTSNLHTHGLHILGSADSDDVTRSVRSGECLDYIWDLDRDHPGGTHWYHAHHHGRAEVQVSGGAFGMLIVEDNPRINPDVPTWAQYERLLQIFARLSDGSMIVNGVREHGRKYFLEPVERDRWFRLRVSVVDPLGLSADFRIDGCHVRKVAHDGIWSSTVPQPERIRHRMSAASRVDYAVRCTQLGHFPIWYDDRHVGFVVVDSEPTSEEIALTEWKPDLPPALQGLREAAVPRKNTWNVIISTNTINGQKWHPQRPLNTIAYGEVHEWTVFDTVEHPFHKHLYHVQIVSPGGCGDMHQEGEFYDTIAGIDSRGGCTFRFRAADFGQREMVHCHNLPHSDFGAMGWVDVEGDQMPRYDRQRPAYQCSRAPTRKPTRSPSWTEPPTDAPTITGAPTSPHPTGRPTTRPTTNQPSPNPTANPTPVPPCVDRDENCGAWASQEECERNPAFMLSWCARTCGACVIAPSPRPTGPTNRPTANPTANPTPAQPCEDRDRNCGAWASQEECERNPAFMLSWCARTCGACVVASPPPSPRPPGRPNTRPSKRPTNRPTPIPTAPTVLRDPTESTPPKEIAIDWIFPGPQGLPSISANIGDTLVFRWEGFHNVYIAPSNSCDSLASGSNLGASSPVRYTVQAGDEGGIVFACEVPGHCQAGMLLSVDVGQTGAPLTESINATTCEDREGDCGGWASLGECERNPSYMLSSCTRACGAC